MIVELVANCWKLFLCHTFYFYSDLDNILVHGQNDKFRLNGPFIDVKAFSNVLKQRVFFIIFCIYQFIKSPLCYWICKTPWTKLIWTVCNKLSWWVFALSVNTCTSDKWIMNRPKEQLIRWTTEQRRRQ